MVLTDNEDFMFLNSARTTRLRTVFRIIRNLTVKLVSTACRDIGYHHRGAESGRASANPHSYIPYTDRIEYLGGCVTKCHVLAVEKLAGITVPGSCERHPRDALRTVPGINSHLPYISTFIQTSALRRRSLPYRP